MFIFVLGLVLPSFTTEQAPVWLLHPSNITFLPHHDVWEKTEFSFVIFDFQMQNLITAETAENVYEVHLKCHCE